MKFEQSFYLALGNWACYALCIINIAEEVTGAKLDHIKAIRDGISKGYISWNENNYQDVANLDVLHPDKFLEMLTAKRWTVRKVFNVPYKPTADEYLVEKWVRGAYGHFIRRNYNSLQDSKCVSLGALESYRVFKEV